MSDVINGVLRDDLKSLLVAIEGTMWADAQWVARCRALLTAQPQASALTEAAPGCFVQPLPSHCDRITWRGNYYQLPNGLTQASAAQNQCGECGFPNGAGPHCGYHGTAQSAPAGEREAFSEKMRSRGGLVGWMLGWNGERYEYQPTQDCWEYFQAGASWQRTQSAGVQEKMQWPEIVELVNEVLGCEAHKFPCERGSIGHEMTGINFNSLARIIDRVRHRLAAPAQPAAQDQGEVQRLREAAQKVISHVEGDLPIKGWLRDNDASRKALGDLRACLAASTGQEVKP